MRFCLPSLLPVRFPRNTFRILFPATLPPASFRFRLTADTLAFGCNLPTIRAVWGLTPVRVRSCWANQQRPPGANPEGLTGSGLSPGDYGSPPPAAAAVTPLALPLCTRRVAILRSPETHFEGMCVYTGEMCYLYSSNEGVSV